MHTVYTDMQIALANETLREESAKSKIQEEHEKCVKALPESINTVSTTNDMQSVLYGLNMSVLLLTRPHGLMLAWANHLAHPSALSFYVVGRTHFPVNSFSSWCFQCVSTVDFLYHSHPVIKHFRFHRTLATLGFQRPLHPANRFYCFQETFENCLPVPPFSGTTTAGAVPWLQSARKIPRLRRSWGVTSRQLRSLCMLQSHVASQKPEKFHQKKVS